MLADDNVALYVALERCVEDSAGRIMEQTLCATDVCTAVCLIKHTVMADFRRYLCTQTELYDKFPSEPRETEKNDAPSCCCRKKTIPRRHQKEHRTDSLAGRAVGGTLLDQRITPLLLEVEARKSHPRAKTDITSIPRKVLK